MIKRKKAKKLFDKYLNGQCTPEEKELLDRYLDSFQDKKKLWSELKFEENIQQEIWAKITSETKKTSTLPSKKPFYKVLKYAAVFVGAVLGFFAWQMVTMDETTPLVISDDDIILKTGDNVVKTIDRDGVGKITSNNGNAIASQDKETISYKAENTTGTPQELVYNEIMVPKGKTFKLVLSDGTMVHLNSHTELRFPVSFIKGQERKVYLKGEAYFEVAKDPEHPFLVEANDMSVKVLGTHFAVNSYSDSQDFAVLVEGSVAVQNQGMLEKGHTIIEPGQKASVEEDGIDVKDVDVSEYLRWRTGTLMFHNEPFSQIVKKIERKYNVEVINNYESMNPIRFYGRFDEESIIDLLDTFKESAGFEYEISDNKIIINKPNHLSP